MFKMEFFLMAIIAILAFICEYIDRSLGMGYGTILTPILIIAGYDILIVVPSVLVLQGLASFSASRYHHKFHNVNLEPKRQKAKIVYFILFVGILTIVATVFIAIHLPETWLAAYIGLLVLFIGVILSSKVTFQFSTKKVEAIGILSAFNKTISGGGFGPVLKGGQVISGNVAFLKAEAGFK